MSDLIWSQEGVHCTTNDGHEALKEMAGIGGVWSLVMVYLNIVFRFHMRRI